jgi:hypothetical protein
MKRYLFRISLIISYVFGVIIVDVQAFGIKINRIEIQPIRIEIKPLPTIGGTPGQIFEKGKKEGGKITTKTVKESGNAINDTVMTIKTGKPHGDLAKTFAKAIDDSAKEINRAGINVNDVAIAAGQFLENQTRSVGTILSDAQKRAREGKVIDAIWHAATDPVKHTEDNFGKAVTRSSLLNEVATAAASTYGGPMGSAAYASWLTYKRTGNLQIALKAGIIAGAVKRGIKIVDGMPTGTESQLAQKTLASASIGGAAVAASGGGEHEIIEAFVKGGALTQARQRFKELPNKAINGKAPAIPDLVKYNNYVKHKFSILVDKTGKPILDAKGNQQLDIRTITFRDISKVSIDNSSLRKEILIKIPYINDMVHFHDQWETIAQKAQYKIVATIFPTKIIPIAGPDATISKQSTEKNINKKGK